MNQRLIAYMAALGMMAFVRPYQAPPQYKAVDAGVPDNSAVKARVNEINIRHGAQRFHFNDGFSCIARNQANADRKHRNWMEGK